MTAMFWICLFFIVYTYAGYPLCLALLRRITPRPVAKAAFQPEVSVVLAARNEEHRIKGRIANLVAQDYPHEKLQIVIVSDGSSDGTVSAAREAGSGRVAIVPLAEGKGKAVAVNAGVAQATGDIIVFCDARQSFEPDVIRELVRNFADGSVGCVSGELMLGRRGNGAGPADVGLYWRYEKWIRKAESATGSVVGATGAIYAIRRSLYRSLPEGTLLDDVMTPMQVVMQGYRTVFDPAARAHDVLSKDLSQESVRKVRTLAGNWQLLALLPSLLVPWRNPCWWRFLSHKFLRLVVPVPLILLMVCSCSLKEPFYRAAALLQSFLYCLAAVGAAIPATRRNRLVSLSYFFLVMNLLPLAGFWRWATGRSATVWQPAYQGKGE